jgi:hypothetical protein
MGRACRRFRQGSRSERDLGWNQKEGVCPYRYKFCITSRQLSAQQFTVRAQLLLTAQAIAALPAMDEGICRDRCSHFQFRTIHSAAYRFNMTAKLVAHNQGWLTKRIFSFVPT